MHLRNFFYFGPRTQINYENDSHPVLFANLDPLPHLLRLGSAERGYSAQISVEMDSNRGIGRFYARPPRKVRFPRSRTAASCRSHAGPPFGAIPCSGSAESDFPHSPTAEGERGGFRFAKKKWYWGYFCNCVAPGAKMKKNSPRKITTTATCICPH